MEITTLPIDLEIDVSENLQLYDYRTFQDLLKSKITLSKHTISFLRTGVKEVIGHGYSEQINNEHFLIMKSGNCLMTEKTSNSGNIYQSILLFFEDATVLEFLEKYQLTASSNFDKKSFFVFEYDDFIFRFVNSLDSLLKLPKKTQSKLLKPKFEEIMLYLTHKYEATFLNAIVQNIDDRNSRMNIIVESNKFKKLSLEELAFLCNMSISTFKREFFKQYQNTPMKWFNEQRLQHVANLLRINQKRPIDLFEEAGYENFSNFVQAFKKQFGKTPKQYQSQF